MLWKSFEFAALASPISALGAYWMWLHYRVAIEELGAPYVARSLAFRFVFFFLASMAVGWALGH